MNTLGQERAKFAYDQVQKALAELRKGEKEANIAKDFSSFVAGLPAMILQNGLGHTLCFLLAKAADQKKGDYKKTGKETKYWLAFEALASWLKNQKMLSFDSENPTETVKKIAEMDALQYLAVQEEALRFLEWFKVMSKMFVEEEGA